MVSILQPVLHSHLRGKSADSSIFKSRSPRVRLNVFRLLVKKGPEGMVAGEIATALDAPPGNLSFHFKALAQARLLSVEQEGRFRRYRADSRRPLLLNQGDGCMKFLDHPPLTY
ncbi:MAG: helix-turn-helix transcriptional regulator [Polaromonas sp.]|nr:helix-turn-helix transcriptional regulator [Polaromonas sp.]